MFVQELVIAEDSKTRRDELPNLPKSYSLISIGNHFFTTLKPLMKISIALPAILIMRLESLANYMLIIFSLLLKVMKR